MNKEQYLTEAMGHCWPAYKKHNEWLAGDKHYFNICKKCGRQEYYHLQHHPFPNMDSANKFFYLWDWARTQSWWEDYRINNLKLDHSMVNYKKFSNSLYKYLKTLKGNNEC